MKHSTLLEILYGDNLSEITNVLNKSIYAKNYEVKDEKQITVHTGFSFTLHTEKKMDLLYDINSETIISQLRFEGRIPKINGIFISKGNEHFYNLFSKRVVTDILKGDNTKGIIKPLKEPWKYLCIDNINEIIVVDKENNREIIVNSVKIHDNEGMIIDVPLQRDFAQIIYFDGASYSSYLSDSEYYEDYENEDELY